MTFHVPADLRGQLEVLPEHGLVQGESSFPAQLKFLPSPGIFSCRKYLELGSGYLDVPLEIRVAGQVSGRGGGGGGEERSEGGREGEKERGVQLYGEAVDQTPFLAPPPPRLDQSCSHCVLR